MHENNIGRILPLDDELVRRENLFLGLFDRFSMDESEDAELADLQLSDNAEDEDDNASGSSFLEVSSIEGEDDDDEDESNGARLDMGTINKQLAPIIQERVNAWPEKGIHLQLKRVDPSLSVSDWLKANQESTTTTKKYRKTVVSECNKTITTTTKHTKTTTTKSSFNAYVPSRLTAIQDTTDLRPGHQIPPVQITEITDDNVVSPAKTTNKRKPSKKKPKDQQQPSKHVTSPVKLSVSIGLSRLRDLPTVRAEPEFSVPEPPKKSQNKRQKKEPKSKLTESKSIVPEPPKKTRDKLQKQESKTKQTESKAIVAEPPKKTQDKLQKKEPKTKQTESKAIVAEPPEKTQDKLQKKEPKTKQTESKSKKKSSPPVVAPSVTQSSSNDVNRSTRSLRSRHKENIPPPVQREILAQKPPTRKPTAPKKSRSRMREHQCELSSYELPTTVVAPSKTNTNTNTVHSRSRSPLKDLLPVQKLRSVSVNVKRLHHPDVATRSSARIRNRSMNARANETNATEPANRDGPLQRIDVNAQTRTANRSLMNWAKNKSLLRLPKTIVVYSPSSEVLLGTKIDDTLMMVKKTDFAKGINPKHLRRTNVFERSVIPINRRVIYQPPVNESMDTDSESEDVLLSSYMNRGRFVQYDN